MERKIVVTGATGNVGSAVAHSLLKRDISVRLAGPRVDVLRQQYPGVEAVELDLLNSATFARAIQGATGLFLIRPPAIARVRRTVNAFIDHAVSQQIRHIVFSSVAGAGANRLIPHTRIESHLRASNSNWSILRPGFFSQNLAEAYRQDIGEDDRIYLPAGEGKVAFIDTRDIGEAAAHVLANPAAHVGQIYHLTGPESLDFSQVADILSEYLQRPIRYEPATIPGYIWHLRRRRCLSLQRTMVQTILHAGLRRGAAESVNSALSELLQRDPRTLKEFIREHVPVWRS